jgi:flavin reductase (DIM6/NTAB) family NADH-FMN oxidoreductase RutF
MTEEPTVVTGVLPCAVVILTVAAGEQRDAMTATAVFVSEDPPLLAVSVAEHLRTHDLIEQAGEFVINVASPGQLETVKELGSTHGRDVDKFDHFKLATEPSEKLGAPRIAESYACLECKVVASHMAASYRVYTAEIVAHTVDKRKGPLVWHQGHYFALDVPKSI